MEDNKTLFKIPLFNIWYVVITLILILMQYLKMIDIHPIWILSPLWLPTAISFSFILILFILKGIIFLIDLKNKRRF